MGGWRGSEVIVPVSKCKGTEEGGRLAVLVSDVVSLKVPSHKHPFSFDSARKLNVAASP